MKTYLIALLPALLLIRFSNHDSHIRSKIAELTATDTLHWLTESCTQIGTFDRSKYTKSQLRNAYNLWFTYNALQISTRNVVYTPNEYYSFDSRGQLQKLEKEYAGKKAEYASMKIPPGKIWSNLLQNRIKDLDATYELAKLDLEALCNPKVLLKSKFAAYCTEYADALASDDTLKLMDAWGSLMKKKEVENFSESGFAKYKNSLKPADRIIYARTYLLTFGWHNCANSHINHEIPNVNYREEFEKLFISIDEKCDE